MEGGDDGIMTLTTAQDLAAVVARAIDYEGEWPEAGGIRGTDMKVGDLIALGEKIRGKFSSIPATTGVHRANIDAMKGPSSKSPVFLATH